MGGSGYFFGGLSLQTASLRGSPPTLGACESKGVTEDEIKVDVSRRFPPRDRDGPGGAGGFERPTAVHAGRDGPCVVSCRSRVRNEWMFQMSEVDLLRKEFKQQPGRC